MHSKRYTDPLGKKLPALEQCIIKYRAIEMLLVLFHAEELRRDVLDLIQSTDRFSGRFSETRTERVPKGVKNPVDKALSALVVDKAITETDKKEIVELIDYRNIIAHKMHKLLVDVSPEKIAQSITANIESKKYNYDAFKRLKHFRKLLNNLYRTHHYIRTIGFNNIIFAATEKTLLSELKKLNKRIVRHVVVRKAAIKKVNSELSLQGTGLDGELSPQHPLNQYDNRRLTERGVEICYRLFDLGKSPMAVAHIMRLSIHAVRKRRKLWAALGGKKRPKIRFENISRRRFTRRN